MSIGYSDIWVGGGADQGWVGTVLPKVLFTKGVAAVDALAAVATRCRRCECCCCCCCCAGDDDDDDGAGDDDDDDSDNDDTYDDDDDQNFDRRLLSTILDSGTRPYMPGKRATSRVERSVMLLTALKPDRMGAERTRLLNKEQHYPIVVTHSLTHSVRDQRSDFLRITHHQLNGKNPSR